MADFIDRQAALDLDPPPKHLRQYQTIVTVNLDDVYEDGWYDFQTQLLQLPPADVKPVVRGKWKQYRKGIDLQCSRCYWSTDFGIPLNFCPNCGSYNGGDFSVDE